MVAQTAPHLLLPRVSLLALPLATLVLSVVEAALHSVATVVEAALEVVLIAAVASEAVSTAMVAVASEVADKNDKAYYSINK